MNQMNKAVTRVVTDELNTICVSTLQKNSSKSTSGVISEVNFILWRVRTERAFKENSQSLLIQ